MRSKTSSLRPVAMHDQIDLGTKPSDRSKPVVTLLLFLFFSCALVLAANLCTFVFTGVVIPFHNDSKARNKGLASRSLQERQEQLKSLFSSTVSSAEALEDSATPQSRALFWLADESEENAPFDDTGRLLQRYILAVLYFSTGGGETWNKQNNFLSKDHECEWSLFEDSNVGIAHCDTDLKVASIILDGIGLHGHLPQEIGHLSALNILSLRNGSLKGTIPTEVGELTKLTLLLLSNNGLTGKIPASLSNLTRVDRIWLDGNNLSGDAGFLCDGFRVSDLRIDQNKVSCKCCSCCFVESNRREKLLGVISPSLSASDLFLDGNSPQSRALDWLLNIDEFELSLDDKQRVVQRYVLAVLYFATGGELWTEQYHFLSGNHECDWKLLNNETGFYEGVFSCDGSRVEGIFLVGNQLIGTIPGELSGLQLKALFLRDNFLVGQIPTSLFSFKELSHFDLSKNALTGSIPTELGNLSKTVWFSVGVNKLRGTIPTEIGQLSELTAAIMSSNIMSGTIPTELSRLKRLEMLALWGNSLNGTIPSVIGTLKHLTLLSVSSNNLSGSIPKELGQLVHLDTLRMWGNNFVGTIPSELSSLIRLRDLDLSENILSGTLPSFIANFVQLELLGLDNNPMNGSLYPQIGRLSALKYLSLSNMRINGSVPSNLGSLSQLTRLLLWGNEINGQLPKELGNLSALTAAGLAYNKFEGTVPLSFSGLQSLVEIYLHNNEIVGNIDFLCDALPNLETLHVDLETVDCSCCECCQKA